MSYAEFLGGKAIADEPSGFAADVTNEGLFDWQREIVRWGLARGRSAVFADTGLGKTRIQLEWAQQVAEHTDGRVLILAPLAVSSQTEREAKEIGVAATAQREPRLLPPHSTTITNYERLAKFADQDDWAGIVLDESSILKAYDGKTRRAITEFAQTIPYRLACTATPAPNDQAELTSHAEFLSVMRRDEVMALFFTQDGNSSQRWRLKGHARQGFYRWLASWAVAVRTPSDLGYSDEGFDLPPLNIEQHVVDAQETASTLFETEANTLAERRQARRDSIGQRAERVAELVSAEPDEQWLIWCDLNAEADAVKALLPDAQEVRGPDHPDRKEELLLGFSAGDVRTLVTKPSIAGWGMNWQGCARMAFLGLSDSYEQFYQAVRRCWRYGQTRPVTAHVVTARAEGAVKRNIERKERQSKDMMDQIVSVTSGLSFGQAKRQDMEYEVDERSGHNWRMLLGDSVDQIAEVESESVGLTVFSPPFPGMYVYTNSPRDMGNVASIEEMVKHYSYLAPELLRVSKPGRSCAVHLAQGVAHKWRDGYIGRRDFRGDVIRTMEEAGWIYYGEVTIDKDPQVKAIRTKDRGLLFQTLSKDSSHMRMAMADYMLQFRKPGDNPDPIRAGISEKYDNPNGWITDKEWIEWAAPVWYSAHRGIEGGIRETDVLNVRQARETNDERHLCPLQLGVIERAVKLWSNPGDLVLSPFAGIGSEGVESIRHGRHFVGIELKRSYFETACTNLADAPIESATLLDQAAA